MIKSNTNASPAPAVAVVEDPRRRRLILIAVCSALMAVIGSVSGLNVAQPHLAAEFELPQSGVLWLINAYTVTLAALLLPLGAVGDRLGRKPVLVTGLVLFGIASAAAGIAWNFESMLVARFLSGVGAAMIMPVTLAAITATFPPEERSSAVGVWTGVAGAGGVLGMFLSALLVDVASWRWLFALPIALVIIALSLTLRAMPDSSEATVAPFDWVGAVASIVSVVGWTFLLDAAPKLGWSHPLSVQLLALAGGSTVAFVWWERRQRAPMLDMNLLALRNVTAGATCITVFFAVQAGVFIVLYPFFQVVLGWSGLRATLGLMPMAILMMLAAVAAPRLSRIVGIRWSIATGVLLFGAGLALLAELVSVDGGYGTVLPGMVAMGLGMGLTMTPATEAITSALPRDRQGIASALNDVTRELGMALGVALLGAVASSGYRAAIEPHLDGLARSDARTAAGGIAGAIDVASSLKLGAPALMLAARESFVRGWRDAMHAGLLVTCVLFVFIVLRGPTERGSNEAR